MANTADRAEEQQTPGMAGQRATVVKDSTVTHESVSVRPRHFKTFGITALILGALMIVLPTVSTIAVELLVAAAFTLGGVAYLLHASVNKGIRGTTVSVLVGALYLVVGLYLFLNPFSGAIAISAVVGVLFLIEGVATLATIGVINRRARGMSVFSGLAAMLLGAILLFGLPEIGLAALGILAGINLITTGISALSVARHA